MHGHTGGHVGGGHVPPPVHQHTHVHQPATHDSGSGNPLPTRAPFRYVPTRLSRNPRVVGLVIVAALWVAILLLFIFV